LKNLFATFLQIWCNILIINNTKLTIITNPVRVVGFFSAADFTEHKTTKITGVNQLKENITKK
jgi:hypothetical protein